MQINQQKRYIFKKPYTVKAGTIPEGSQLDVVHGTFYFNGGMADNYSTGLFKHILENPQLKNDYLQEVTIPINKI